MSAANGNRLSADAKAMRQALYDEGLSDAAIGRRLGVSHFAIGSWRRVRNLPSARERRMTGMQARREAMLANGLTDRQIAAAEGVSSSGIVHWRRSRSIAANKRPKAVRPRPMPEKRITPMAHPIFAAVAAAIGGHLGPDLTDDARSEMLVAVLEGMPLPEAVANARRFRKRALDQLAGRFTHRSLSDPIGGEGDMQLVDMIRDDRSSSWLEEMGATVW